MARPLQERFDECYTTIPESGCWIWLGGTDPKGYGRINIKDVDGSRINKRAHRISYQLHKGPIPDDLCVLHRCDVPGCVNPDHLFLGTVQDNVSDMVSKRRQHSPKGTKNSQAILTEQDIVEIRDKYIPHVYTYRMLAEEYGVTIEPIRRVVNRMTWNHIG